MNKIQGYKVKSELLTKHWNIVSDTYVKALAAFNRTKSELVNLHKEVDGEKVSECLRDLLQNEWRKIYPEFVLAPLENEVRLKFRKVQTKEFIKTRPLSAENTVFGVYYYVCQYFHILISTYPYDLFKNFHDIEIQTNDSNLLLREIFEEIWKELDSLDETELSDYYEFTGYQIEQIEIDLLTSFLANLWNETKVITKSDAKAILSESTSCGSDFFLDENRILDPKNGINEILNQE